MGMTGDALKELATQEAMTWNSSGTILVPQ